MKILAAVLFLVTVAARADEDLIDADRPGIADGSHTVHARVFQVEAGVQLAKGSLSTPLLLRYGLTERFEARVETDAYTRDGWAPLSVGFKYHLLDEPSLGVIARFFVPSGSRDARSDHFSGDVRLAADVSFGEKWSINPNVGVAVSSDGERFTAATAALTVQYNFSSRANVFVDGGLQTPEERGGSTSLLLDTGAAWIIGNNLQLDASIGWGAHGRSTPNVFWSAGLGRRF